jgi:hypothetical protein
VTAPAGPRSVQPTGTITVPSGPPSQLRATPPASFRSNRTRNRRPDKGWNGCVMVTNDSETSAGLRERAVCDPRRHPQQTLATPRFGDYHPADRRGLVGARVQRLPNRCPVLAQPRTKLVGGHAVYTRRAPVGFDTPQRPAQILRCEHLLPQRDLQARDRGLPGVRRLAATLRCGLQRTSPSPPCSEPASRGMAAITATGTSTTDSSATLDVRSFPATTTIPGRYYDLC